ncbi:MAG TPA: hypothetical protein VLJ37_07440 [bacterium]|nr:hypothetical protein [bacterium]
MCPIATTAQKPMIPSPTASLVDPSAVVPKDPETAQNAPAPPTSQFSMAEAVQGAAAFIRETLASVPGMNKVFARAPVEPNQKESTRKKETITSSAEERADGDVIGRLTRETVDELTASGVDPIRARYIAWRESEVSMADLAAELLQTKASTYDGLPQESRKAIEEQWRLGVRQYTEQYRQGPLDYTDSFLRTLSEEGWSQAAIEKSLGEAP